MKILTVYNTCGIKNEQPMWYMQAIQSILDQTNINNKTVVSSCLNTDGCISYLKNMFGESLDIYRYNEPHTVNITFNKTVQEVIKKYGEFDGYLFIDSGITLYDPNIICEGAKRLNDFGIVSFQTDTDTGYGVIGLKQDSDKVQIVKEDLVLPIGTAVNAHAQIFHNDIYKKFGKIIPDVFAAFCTESAYPFVSLSVDKRWVIVKDILLHHRKAVDGPSSGQSHVSQIHKNPWNNLLYNRNALDFINDSEALDAGLGYEECNKVMLHKEEAYENGIPKDSEKLSKYVDKYFFLNNKELDYDSINIEEF